MGGGEGLASKVKVKVAAAKGFSLPACISEVASQSKPLLGNARTAQPWPFLDMEAAVESLELPAKTW